MPDFPFFNNDKSDFPSLNGLNGQRYSDTFDYASYEQPAKIRLLNAPWRSDYNDVVRFESESARDNWLNSNSTEHVEYSTAWLRIPQQSINVPLPYERASYFNYLFVDVPELPVEGSNAPARLCYFIVDIRYAAPSTTVLDLELDVWQTYGYRMQVDSLELERGHAPMYRSSVDGFLANPIANSRYLLAPDVNFESKANRIANVEHYPIGSGQKWLIVALPIAPSDLAVIGTGTVATSTAPTYSDLSQRNGYQLNVGGYVWAHDGYSYQSATLPVDSGSSADNRTLSPYIYGIAYPDAKQALGALALQAPQVLASARYLAVIPSALVNYATSITLCGYSWNVLNANPTVEIEPFDLTRDNIGLPDYARDIAKLYTSPYTHLEIADQAGNSFEVRIEDIAGNSLEFNADVSLASATLLFNIEAVNVGTSDALTVAWRELDGSATSTLYGSDIAKYALKWGIPTYSVALSAGTLEAARKWRNIAAQRQAALNVYHQAVRSANTALANMQAANTTTVSNTSAANATAVTNTANSGNTATANQTLSNNRDTAITSQNVNTNATVRAASYDQAFNLSYADDEYQQGALDVAATTIGMTAANNAVGALASGNVIGAMSSGFSAALSITNNQAMADLSLDSIYAKQSATLSYINLVANAQQTNMTNNTNTSNTAATAINTNNVSLANTNAANSAATSNANANATAATSNANAGYSREDAILTAKENLGQAQIAALAALNAADLDIADIASTTGDNALDALNRRSFSVKSVTQSDYALRATTDNFKRYGYVYNAPITPTSWLEGGDYCYWQGKRAIIKGEAPDAYRRALAMILEQGVTVWNSPESVGNYA